MLDNKLWNTVILGGVNMNMTKSLKWLSEHKFDAVKEVYFNCWRSGTYQAVVPMRVKLMFAKLQSVRFSFSELKSCDLLKSFMKLEKLQITLCGSYIPCTAQLLKNSQNSLTEILFWTASLSFCQSLLKHDVTFINLKTLELDKFYNYKKDSISCLQK